ncbi:ubiquinone anaerobic biosynthesis accessory factor UbiT [Brenneria rubrifaciens]|uniref:Ubiquinone biosynthesis accessory factor UbiT n=1 Tax=Brenneria rubrifaciens TaxID=55213 RepID=A0A4V1F9G7_9GAMM|nr:SCP2 domain-containing protein [Brenneria rubrifaciens]QCR07513.1 SCP2 domain-containing protein [Brenneria rubrifaciens]
MLKKLRAQIVRRGPGLLGKPLKFTPFSLQRQVLEQMLRWQFRQALDDGDLEFLAGRWLKIEVRDVGLRWFMTLRDNRLVVSQQETPDVSFSADANDLILIAARKEDPDTLFFQRRLRIEGDTELGLYVKNLMDAIELENLPAALRIGLIQLADFVEAGSHEGVVQTSDRAPVSC